MIHWPIWRPPGGEPMRTPPTRRQASVRSGPSIQGIGVCSRLQIQPATAATASPAPPRRHCCAIGDDHFPMQNREKIAPSRSSAVNSPVIADSAACAPRSSSAKSSSAAGDVLR